MKKIWFRRKIYGWGWYPSTWEGWLVILVWAVIFALIMSQMEQGWLKKQILIFISVGILIYICYKKGEPPRWQWGKKDKN